MTARARTRRRTLPARPDPQLVREAWRRFGDLPADRELIVDLFAGGGGASLGIEQALGRSPDVAINHDAEAVAMHAANHPSTWHLVSDVWEVSPSAVTAGRRVGLLWASPDCKHFSKAKGGRPVKKRIRALAWVVIKWAREVAPRVIILENVEEFATWGPLVQKVDATGAKVFDLHGSPVMVPCKKRKGETFHRWRRMLERLGYRFEWRERRACNSGAGTIRKRLYGIARRDGAPIVWPADTHADPKKKATGLLPWVTAADSIDFSLPCPSIFETAEQIKQRFGIRAQRPLKPKTMARIAKGVWRYVINSAEPFIIPVTHAGDIRVNPVDEPLRTGTCARRGEHAIVQPFLAGVGGRMGQSEPRPTSEPAQTLTAKGDAVVVAPFVTKFRNGATGQPATDPLATITAHTSEVHPGGNAPLGVVAPYLVRTDMASAFERNGVNTVEEPARTFTTAPSHAVVAPYLVPRYQERDGQEPRTRSVELPAATAVPQGNEGVLVAATMVTNFHGETPEYPVGTPVRTIMTGRHQALVSAFLAQHNYMEPGHDAREPVSTIVQKGCTQAVVQAELEASAGIVNLHGTSERQLMPRDVAAPAPTITAQGSHVAEVRAFLVKYHALGGQHAELRDPMPTVDCNDRLGLVTVRGVEYHIVDIGMRMLTPRERFNANGFPRSYVIDVMVPKTVGRTRKRVVMKPLSGEAQGRMVGNSVCPPEACALARANVPELGARGGAAAMPEAAVGAPA